MNYSFFMGLLLSSAAFAAPADEPNYKHYGAEAVELIETVHFNCPVQFIQAMKNANKIISVNSFGDLDHQTGKVYIITTGLMRPSAGFGGPPNVTPLSSLKMTIQREQQNSNAPDKPQGLKATCELGS